MTNDERLAWQKMLDDRQIEVAGIEFMTGEKWFPPGSEPSEAAAAPQPAAETPAQAGVVIPPPDAAVWHVAINNQQQGPYNRARLGDMLAAKEITPQSLVWKKGIPGNNWTAMEAVEELQELLADLPPPIPTGSPSPDQADMPPPMPGAPVAETVQDGTSSDMEDRFQKAMSLYRKERYHEAAPLLKALAEEGHAEAQLYIGYCFDFGRGVGKYKAKAFEWYHKAAEQGNAHAQYKLGSSYHYGIETAQDYAQAAEWYGKAAEQGDNEAKTALKELKDRSLI